MELTSALTILAIIIGPIAAVQVQKWTENYQEKRGRKLEIFKMLMATRGERVSFNHVKALNMIDTEFYDKREITDAWKCYLDCLKQQTDGDVELKSWAKDRDELFVDLLSKMAELLGYKFDKVHLNRAVYIPRAHGEEQEYQHFIRDCIKKIFTGEQAIPVTVKSSPTNSEEELKKQENAQSSI